MHKLLLDLPTRIDTERLYLRPYQASDGPWYYAMSLRNRTHLARYEPNNPIMTLKSEQEAEILMRELANDWNARDAFFMGAFLKRSDEFAAQVYLGSVDWALPEFQIGYFAEKDQEGHGYVSEALKGVLRLAFEHLKANRVRLECDASNKRSWRVAERCGLVREGHLRQNKMNPDGSFSDTFYYGLLRDEFQVLYGL